MNTWSGSSESWSVNIKITRTSDLLLIPTRSYESVLCTANARSSCNYALAKREDYLDEEDKVRE
jgi:hypothetical protein